MAEKYPILYANNGSQLIEASIYEARKTNAKDRQKMRSMMIDFYQGDQYCQKEYQNAYGFGDIEFPNLSTRLTRRVIDNNLAMVYKSPPERKLMVGKPGSEKELDNDGLQEFLYDNPEYDLIVKKLERYHNLLNNVLYRFVYTDRWYFFIETEFIPKFGPDNKLYPIGYDIPMPEDVDGKEKPRNRWLFISDEEIYYHDDKGNKWGVDPQLPDDFVNPYGIMPLIDMSDSDIDLYWGNGLRALVEFHRIYNLALLDGFFALHQQAHNLLWAKDLDLNLLPKNAKGEPYVKSSAATVLNVGPDGEVGAVNFNPQLPQSIEYLRQAANMELANYGITINFRESGNPMSGFAIVVSNRELIEKREHDIQRYIMFERKAYKILQVMNEYHDTGYNMPSESWVSVDWREIDFPQEPTEERAQELHDLKLNLITREELLIRRNPDLTPEIAKEIISQNSIDNRATRGLFETPEANQ